ncbi:MocR-like pyridoxine biosynthesis transcription factor PdxR [Pseudonocardia oceani]|uniref:PLP-dependent aminotransferase family protein n=3 Tax=Pseudonocardia oceani TaxID=2792013 RepID=A0ABS6UDJ1_9PSEU|nr:PLP-dependent aminotransferase family protein [Pseudonocardia oceani]MBW0130314.1 PLP-dependent aminotransferase family protein [Pseudonocardia oceani]
MPLPPIVLDRAGEHPLSVQLADALRAATADGVLRTGDRLPSTRELAVTLGVSRTVTAGAYDQLLAEGWVGARRGSGTYVEQVPPGAARAGAGAGPSCRKATFPPPEGRNVAFLNPGGAGALVDLSAGSPCLDALDPAAWRRAWRAAADGPADAGPDPVGMPAFRAAVVEHLLRHRGLPADPATVLVTSGSSAAVAELARTFPPGSRVAVEEPGYRRAVSALRAAGLVVVPVPVDAAGLVVDAVPPGVVAVYCTPAHQYPLGVRLSAARRVALVERARAEGFLVVEDDYDGELRYDVAPLPLLAALGPDVVAHLGTVSKLLTPTLGVGWLVAPPAVVGAVLAQREATGMRPARAGQRVFVALAAHGDLARHLRRLRRELAGRRADVVAALAGVGVAVTGDEAGGHVVALLPGPDAERRAIADAAAGGIHLDGLGRHHVGEPATSGIVLGYAGPPGAGLRRALPVAASALRAALGCGDGRG